MKCTTKQITAMKDFLSKRKAGAEMITKIAREIL